MRAVSPSNELADEIDESGPILIARGLGGRAFMPSIRKLRSECAPHGSLGNINVGETTKDVGGRRWGPDLINLGVYSI